MRVAARGHHARAGGQGQPVAIVPAQRAGNRPVGDPAGGVDPAQAVHYVRGQGGRCPGEAGRGRVAAAPGLPRGQLPGAERRGMTGGMSALVTAASRKGRQGRMARCGQRQPSGGLPRVQAGVCFRGYFTVLGVRGGT